MFILNEKDFGEFDLKKARQFIVFWANIYANMYPKNKAKIENYLTQLNLEKGLNRLTGENVKQLLRWKDPRRLTEERSSGPNGGKKNEKVTNVIDNIDKINDFRFGKMNEKDFESETKDIFRRGIVWRAFLFHIARPFEYPIADQNVFRTFKTHKKVNEPEDFEEYKLYKDYFFEVSKYAGVITGEPTGDESNIKDIVGNLKEVDNALFAFGKFLKTYGDRNEPKNRSDLLRRE